MRIQIFHNQNERESFRRGYKEGDPLVRVYDGTKEDAPNLEKIFKANQHVDYRQRPWYPDARSLSMGDVIGVDDKAYAIERAGFVEVPLPRPY